MVVNDEITYPEESTIFLEVFSGKNGGTRWQSMAKYPPFLDETMSSKPPFRGEKTIALSLTGGFRVVYNWLCIHGSN